MQISIKFKILRNFMKKNRENSFTLLWSIANFENWN